MREEKDMRVVNFGSLNIDYVYRVDHFVQPGETMSAQSLQIQCGGKGLNQSVALARAGVETWHAGLIGPEGHFLKETLDRAGVHTRFVEESAGSTGHAIIQVDANGQNYKEVERLEDVIGELDLLYMTRVQQERFFNEEDYIRLKDFYILNKRIDRQPVFRQSDSS